MDDITNATAQMLKSFIERIERLEDEKSGISEDIKDVYAEIKGNGFDTKAVRKIIAMRKQDASERQEQDEVVALYCQALGMQ